jgi:hypothetical protein
MLHYCYLSSGDGIMAPCCLNTKQLSFITPPQKKKSVQRHYTYLLIQMACHYFSEDNLCSFIYGNSLHKLVKFNLNRRSSYREKSPFCFWGCRMIIFTGYRPMMDKLSTTQYECSSSHRSGASMAHRHTYRWYYKN